MQNYITVGINVGISAVGGKSVTCEYSRRIL